MFGSCSIGVFICEVVARGSRPKARTLATWLSVIEVAGDALEARHSRGGAIQGHNIAREQNLNWAVSGKFATLRREHVAIIKSHSIKNRGVRGSRFQEERCFREEHAPFRQQRGAGGQAGPSMPHRD